LTFVAKSVVKDVEESLVEFFLPDGSLGGDTNDDERLVGAGVDIYELALLRRVLDFGVACWVRLCLVQSVCESHVHLDLDSRQADVVVFIADDQVLVGVMPEQRMGLHLDELVIRVLA
jgi:hypothetical protein